MAFLDDMTAHELRWLDPDDLDDHDVDGALALLAAATEVDRPHESSPTREEFVVGTRIGWDGDPLHTALACDKRGRVVGLLQVSFSTWDNRHVGYVEVTVDPAVRRQGLGRRLLEGGCARAVAEGKTLLRAGSFDEPAGTALAARLGFCAAQRGVQRRQDLLCLDWAGLDGAFAGAEHDSADYELVRIAGAVPEPLLHDVVVMTAAINDAPIDDLEIEDEVFSPDRIRAFERAQRLTGQRIYRVAARHRATGDLVGHTMVSVESAQPGRAHQFDTSVLRAHRGHRLGVRLKIAMLRWLATEEPQLRHIDTWNAATNEHMIGVNELLGYRVMARAIDWQRRA